MAISFDPMEPKHRAYAELSIQNFLSCAISRFKETRDSKQRFVLRLNTLKEATGTQRMRLETIEVYTEFFKAQNCVATYVEKHASIFIDIDLNTCILDPEWSAAYTKLLTQK